MFPHLFLLLLELLALTPTSAKVSYVRNCADAPDRNYWKTCKMLLHMDSLQRRRLKRQSLQSSPTPNWQVAVPVPSTVRGQGFLQNATACILRDGQPLQMAYRKEYRMMTDWERQRFHAAFTTLKRNGRYDQLGSQHTLVASGSGAHSGPGFLPWHREFLKRVEIALRLVDSSVSIPYWDSVLDQYLPDPKDSILFSNDFVGETDYYGNVIYGPYAYWPANDGRTNIVRYLGTEGQLLNEALINGVVNQSTVEDVLAFTAPGQGCPYPTNYRAIEYVHANVHLWVGGHMKWLANSASEPLFFFHHAFVDYIWELWRQLRQPKWYREQGYSVDHPYCTNALHFSNAEMRPFPYLRNSDGLSNQYTDMLYRYAPRPRCTAENPNCGSRWLFCDTRGYPHCVAKVKVNGICRGFESFDVCSSGRCWYGRCVVSFAAMRGVRTASHRPRPIPIEPLVSTASSHFVDCHNRHPCCDAWARSGTCNGRPVYMGIYCAAACGVCEPAFSRRDECANRHLNCVQWAKLGMCAGEAKNFMAENCRRACGVCVVKKEARCFYNGKLLPLPIGETLSKQIEEELDGHSRRRVRAAAESNPVKIRAFGHA